MKIYKRDKFEKIKKQFREEQDFLIFAALCSLAAGIFGMILVKF